MLQWNHQNCEPLILRSSLYSLQIKRRCEIQSHVVKWHFYYIHSDGFPWNSRYSFCSVARKLLLRDLYFKVENKSDLSFLLIGSTFSLESLSCSIWSLYIFWIFCSFFLDLFICWVMIFFLLSESISSTILQRVFHFSSLLTSTSSLQTRDIVLYLSMINFAHDLSALWLLFTSWFILSYAYLSFLLSLSSSFWLILSCMPL